jgi:hypothetical protein
VEPAGNSFNAILTYRVRRGDRQASGGFGRWYLNTKGRRHDTGTTSGSTFQVTGITPHDIYTDPSGLGDPTPTYTLSGSRAAETNQNPLGG